ncbi:MAG: class I SAM-dependent methyltransferase [Magnetococcales bacterium]|nr:class I SAM-dependent methyltransferase [Magnetococcales bacterium]
MPPSFRVSRDVALPKYLEETYWWAYLHPTGVRFFERQWIVNMILWGNFVELRNAALAEIGAEIHGNTAQLACVYGDFTLEVARRLTPGATLDVVDVAPVQLENLERKLGIHPQVRLHHQDSTNLTFADASFDHVVVFFLLHEQPAEARARTVQEALRVARPGGKVIFMDYHEPSLINPFRYVMIPILTTLEPFAMEMWREEITDWIPKDMPIHGIHKETYFGGLYQKLVVIR